MPLSESSQSKMANCSSDLTYMHDEFVELLWDNGSVMRGQSNRPRKSSIFTASPPCGGRVSEKDSKDNPYPKIGHFRATESKLNNFLGFGMNGHDDDIGPWFNYPVEDPLHNDYCSEFLNDYSGVNVNSIHYQTNAVPAIRSSFLEQASKDSHNVEQGHATETGRIRPGQPCQLPTQFHCSVPGAKSSEMELCIGNSSSKAHKESGGNGLMNFSHFSRPVALARANRQGVDRSAGNKNKNFFAVSSNTMETTVIEPASGLKSVLGTQDQLSSVQPNQDLIPSPKLPQEVIFIDKTICEGQNSRKNSNPNPTNTCNGSPERIQSSSFAASAALGRHEADKGNEAAVASSSVCSGDSTGPASNDHKQIGKRKHREGEESGYQSEDLEDESEELKKSSSAQGNKSKKRSRAAEVHNLSERRRRDRINERMRALQELIPNCNKTDKASMLDEAIEYLKSLQMQLQMVSMGSGFCMPPVMMRAPAMAHFSPMGIQMGMGIGLSYGMGMYDMNGSPACSFIPVSPIQGPQFPCPSIPGPRGLHRVPGSSNTTLQMFGIPGQGLRVPMPYHPPPASSADAKITPVAATMSLQSKGLEKTS